MLLKSIRVTDIKKKDIKEGAIIVQIRWLCTEPKIVGSIFEIQE